MRKKVEDILRPLLANQVYKVLGIRDFFYLQSYHSCWASLQTRNDWRCLASKKKPVSNSIYSINAAFLSLSDLFDLTSHSQLVADRLQFVIVEGNRHFISIGTNCSSLEAFVISITSIFSRG